MTTKSKVRKARIKAIEPQEFQTFQQKKIKTLVGEFWTARQRQMHSLHYVISYRASFKPELPKFFIDQYSQPGDRVFDPFGGRGTTSLQANLMGRLASHNDVNPISGRIALAKLNPVSADEVAERLELWNLQKSVRISKKDKELLVFFHKDTLKELINLKKYISERDDAVSRFIELVALSRLHGHSAGFFSVYTFPQISVPIKAQARINKKRQQTPEYRELKPRIMKKLKQILKSGELDQLRNLGSETCFSNADSRFMTGLESNSSDLIVTSPPFLDKVDYVQDNWLKCWFLDVPNDELKSTIMQTGNLQEWTDFIHGTLQECSRILKPGARAVVEVGEVKHKNKIINLDEILALAAKGTGLKPEKVYIHTQTFTKLANCFNVDNNSKGTNTHRCMVFKNAG